MKAPPTIVVLAFVCTATWIAPAGADPVESHGLIAAEAADLQSYWTETLAIRGEPFTGPSAIVYYTSRTTTPCGPTAMHNARYCPGDDAIYLDETWIDLLLSGDDVTPLAILAHEWGHRVQNQLGDYDRSRERPYLRALELQADCYAGLFLRSEHDQNRVDAAAVADARRFFLSAGDPSSKTRNHGTGPERLAWFISGYSTGNLDVCATVFRKEHAMPRIPSEQYARPSLGQGNAGTAGGPTSPASPVAAANSGQPARLRFA